jgi:DUF4097 and DUF4098 domain-containing protein YvlB
VRPRGNIGGPLVLIAIGVLFLIHTISPEFRVVEIFAEYWPYFLIAWGLIQLIEIFFRALRGAPISPNGISGGGWFLAVIICFAGLATFEIRRPDTWWRQAGFERGVQVFGEEHDYSITPIQKSVGKTPKIIIESFRGDAKIIGSDSTDLSVSGHKSIRSLGSGESDRANSNTPVEVLVQGNTVVVRCNQDKAGPRNPVATDLDLSIPRGSSIEATGKVGDFDISSITGEVDISSENAGVHLHDVDGNLKIDTRKSDLVRCTNVKGTVNIRGHGTDIELTKIAGQVTVSGDYTGTVSLHDIAKPVRIESMRTELTVQRVVGQVALDRGSLTVENVVGPLKLVTQATDVTLNGFSDGLDLSIDKGDVEMKPGHLPLSRMTVHTRSGNIELSLPQRANFALSATTDRGEIDNQFGDGLKERSEGHGARLEGSVGTGPDVNLVTDRGSITVRKASGDDEDSESASEARKETSQQVPQVEM